MVVGTSAAFDCRPNHDEATMSTSTTSSATAASNTVSLGASVSGGKTTVTTERTIILAQIRGLQKQLGEVTKQLQTLSPSDPAAIQQRIELEHEIEGIQEEIRALQNELLQKSADQKVQVSAGKDGSADAAAAPSSSSSSSSSSAGSGDGGGSGGGGGAAPAASTATVGSVIDTQA